MTDPRKAAEEADRKFASQWRLWPVVRERRKVAEKIAATPRIARA